MENNWSANPSANEGTFGNEVINGSLLYGILGYLPEESCNVLILDGPNQGDIAVVLEENSYVVTRLCGESCTKPGCVSTNAEELPAEGFGAVISPGWFMDEGETERVSRQAYRLLVANGVFVGCVPGRFAAAIDNVVSSVANANTLANGIEGGTWQGAKELFTPLEIVQMLEAVGFEMTDLYGWQIALQELPQSKLGSSSWADNEIDALLELEFRLAQERSLLGVAPTIQFIAKKPGEPE